jgi:Bacteriophage tail sheath protein
MPVSPTYPGVYIQEVPSGVRSIVGVATSIAAFVDSFTRGPLHQAVRVFNFGDFEREFGGLSATSEASYGIRQFFLNGGGQAYVVRVADGAFATASVDLLDETAADAIVTASAGRQLRGVMVDDPGEWGNALRIEVDYNTSDLASTELFNLTVSEVATAGGREVVLRSESYRNLTMDAAAGNYAVDSVNEDSKLVQLVRQTAAGDDRRPAATGTLGGDAMGADLDPADTFDVLISGGGLHTATLAIPGPVTALSDIARALQAAIRAVAPAEPLLAGATVQLVGTRFRVLAGRGGGAFDGETTLTLSDNAGDPISSAGLDAGAASINVQQYVVGSANSVAAQGAGAPGADGDVPAAAALEGSRPAKSGIYALEDVDLFNLLCLPRAAELYEVDPMQMSAVLAAAESYCAERRAFLLVDVPPSVDDLDTATDWLDEIAAAGLRSRDAAAYFPRPRIPDPLNDFRLRSVGASGTLAGIYSRTDSTRGVWKAPAGIEAGLRNTPDLDYKLTDPENGVINPLGLNAVRTFDVHGTVAWGARTLDGADQQASEWKYVPVRRLALYLEESLYRGTQWAVFEPNDEPLWAQLRLNIGAFMQGLFRQGAFQGSSPKDAYLVKVDSETTTQADINLGIVNILVGFAPLKPAEFVILRIQQLAGQIDT